MIKTDAGWKNFSAHFSTERHIKMNWTLNWTTTKLTECQLLIIGRCMHVIEWHEDHSYNHNNINRSGGFIFRCRPIDQHYMYCCVCNSGAGRLRSIFQMRIYKFWKGQWRYRYSVSRSNAKHNWNLPTSEANECTEAIIKRKSFWVSINFSWNWSAGIRPASYLITYSQH